MTQLITLDVSPDTVNAGWLGGVLILVLVAAVFFLWRNMGKQLNKIEKNLPRDRAERDVTVPSDDEDHVQTRDEAVEEVIPEAEPISERPIEDVPAEGDARKPE